MGLMAELESDAKTLEKLNLAQHSEYKQGGELTVMSAQDSAKAFADNKTLDSVMEKATEEKDKVMKAADDEFAGLEALKTKKGDSGFGTSRVTEERSTSSKKSSSGWSSSSSRSSSYFSSKDPSKDIEDRVSKMMKKAIEIADDEPMPSRRSRRRKKSIIDRIMPRHSKRRKAGIVLGVIAVESAMTVLVMAQQAAKAELKARRESS